MEVNGNELSGTLPDLSGMFDLEELNLSNNNFSGVIPFSLAQLPALKKLFIQINNFTGIPNFSRQLVTLEADNNKLIFRDLEPNRTILQFTYQEQDPVDEVQLIATTWGQKLTLSVSDVGGTNTQYQWFKNGVKVGTVSTDTTLIIAPVVYEDAGE